MFIVKNTENNTMYTVQDLHYYDYLKYHYKSSHFHEYFQYILPLIYQLTFLFIYSFHNRNSVQHHMIYYIHI